MSQTGIKRFGHKSSSDKGRFHPSDIGSGLETVDKMGGSEPRAATSGRGSNSPPRGVVRGDGTESLKGTKVQHKNGKKMSAPGSGSSHIPGDVSKHDGFKTPRHGKQP